MPLYKVSVTATSDGWKARVIQYEAKESKKSYIVNDYGGTKRISIYKIGKYDSLTIDSVSFVNRYAFVTGYDEITKTIDGAVDIIKGILETMKKELDGTISGCPTETMYQKKIIIEKREDY